MPVAPAAECSLSLRSWFRVAVRLGLMIGLLLICLPCYYLHRLARAHNPWPRRFLGAVAWIAGIRIALRGAKASGGVLLLSNHVSWIDIPVLAGAAGTAFVGHDGLAAMPLLRWLCEMNSTVFVARHERASLRDQVAAVRAALTETGALTIFPEGTTSDGTGLLPFKSALLSAVDPMPGGITVQPVLLDYGAQAARIAWVGQEHGLDNFLRILARREPVEVTVHFLSPLTGPSLDNRKIITQSARTALLRTLSADWGCFDSDEAEQTPALFRLD